MSLKSGALRLIEHAEKLDIIDPWGKRSFIHDFPKIARHSEVATWRGTTGMGPARTSADMNMR